MAEPTSTPGLLLDVGGYRLHAWQGGLDESRGGQTVVCHGGLMGPGITWTRVLPLLAEFGPALALDRAGYGRSDAPPAGQICDGAAMLEESRAFLRAARLEPPWLLAGHSLGAIICLLHAYHYPREVAGLVLVEPAHPRLTSVISPTALRVYKINMHALGWLVARGLAPGMGNLLTWQMFGAVRPSMSPVEWQAMVTEYRRPAFFGTALRELDVLEATLLAADRPAGALGPLPLVVLEAEDWFSGRSRGMRAGVRALRQDLLTLSSQASYECVPDCNHVTLPVLAPDRVAAAVRHVAALATP